MTNQTLGKGAVPVSMKAHEANTQTYYMNSPHNRKIYMYKPTFLRETIIVLFSAQSLKVEKKQKNNTNCKIITFICLRLLQMSCAKMASGMEERLLQL